MRGAVYDVDAQLVDQGLLRVQDGPPAVDGGLSGIVQRRRMGAVEVDPLLDGAVEPNQQDPARLELHGKVDRLKAAVRPPAHHAGLKLEGVDLPNLDAMDAGDADRAGLRYAKAAESSDPVVESPPLGVAGVEDVCPGTELVGVVDDDPADPLPRRVPRCFKPDFPI